MEVALSREVIVRLSGTPAPVTFILDTRLRMPTPRIVVSR